MRIALVLLAVMAARAGAETCEGRWCWENPGLQGGSWSDLTARGARDVWVGGDGTSALRFDGSAWAPAPFVAAGLPRDAAAPRFVGREAWTWHANFDMGGVWRFDGTRWNAVSIAGLFTDRRPMFGGAYGAAPDDVWIGGNRLLHWDGVRLALAAVQPKGTIFDMAGTSATDVWAIAWHGNGVAALHYDGTKWDTEWLDWSPNGGTIAMRVPGEPWISSGDGREGVVLRRVKGKWTKVPGVSSVGATLGAGPLGSMWIGSHDGVMQRWKDGRLEKRGNVGNRVYAVLPLADDDVWVAGDDGLLSHWDGAAWASAGGSVTSEGIRFLHATGADDAWARDDEGRVFRRTKAGWARAKGPEKRQGPLWGTRDELWGAAEGGVGRWRGGEWTVFEVGEISALGGGAGTVYVATSEALFRLAGDGFRRVPAKVDHVRRIVVRNADDVWLLDERGLMHAARGTWTRIGAPPWGEKITWAPADHPVKRDPFMRGLAIAGADDVYLATERGLWRWTGAWKRVLDANFESVETDGAGRVWALQEGGTVHALEGGEWTLEQLPGSDIQWMTTSYADGVLRAGGTSGSIVRRR